MLEEGSVNFFMLVMVYLIVFLCVFNMFNSVFSCSEFSSVIIIMGKVFCFFKYLYFKCFGNWFNFSLGGLMIEGIIFVVVRIIYLSCFLFLYY